MLVAGFLQDVLAVIEAGEAAFAEEQRRLLSRTLADLRPPPRALASHDCVEAFFASLPAHSVLSHSLPYSPGAKYFAPLETNLSFPAVENISSLFSYNSIDLSGVREYRAEYVEMLNKLATSVRGQFVDTVTKRKLRLIISRLRRSFPLLHKIPLLLHFYTGVDLPTLVRLFFKAAAEKQREGPPSFFALATSFCKLCKLYLCDYHYPAEAIKDQHLRAPDNHFVEKVYYLDRLDAANLRKLCADDGDAVLALSRALAELGIEVPPAVHLAVAEPSLRAQRAQVLECTARRIDPACLAADKQFQFNAREVKRQSFLWHIDAEAERLRRGCACAGVCPRPEGGKRAAQSCTCLLQSGRECLPNVCRCPCARSPALQPHLPPGAAACHNANFSYRLRRRVRVRESRLCLGFGLFAAERLQRGDFIGYYLGEFLTQREEGLQDAFSKLLDASYLFTIKTAQFNILDAYNYGNQTRFINHMPAAAANAEVKEVAAGGARVICFFATRAIPAGEEIYFDYGKEYVLKWKTDFDAKVARYLRERKTRRDRLKESKFLRAEEDFFSGVLR